MNLDPALLPGRRMYEQARKLRRARLRYFASRVTVVQRDAKVIPFPTKEEVADGRN